MNNPGYKYQVTFDKTFVDRPHPVFTDSIRFCDWKSADEFARSCDGKTVVKAFGGSHYTKSRPILEAIQPK